jgi:hypothetical protein
MKVVAVVVLSVGLSWLASVPFRALSDREVARLEAARPAWERSMDAWARSARAATGARRRTPPPEAPQPPMRWFYVGFLASAAASMLPWGVFFALDRRGRAARVVLAVECLLLAMVAVPFAASGYFDAALWFLAAGVAGACTGFLAAYRATRWLRPACKTAAAA